MKIKLTEKEIQQIQVAAIQKIVQNHIQNLIEKRADALVRELGDEEVTLIELHKRFLGERPVIDTASAAQPLLVPAGLKLDKKH